MRLSWGLCAFFSAYAPFFRPVRLFSSLCAFSDHAPFLAYAPSIHGLCAFCSAYMRLVLMAHASFLSAYAPSLHGPCAFFRPMRLLSACAPFFRPMRLFFRPLCFFFWPVLFSLGSLLCGCCMGCSCRHASEDAFFVLVKMGLHAWPTKWQYPGQFKHQTWRPAGESIWGSDAFWWTWSCSQWWWKLVPSVAGMACTQMREMNRFRMTVWQQAERGLVEACLSQSGPKEYFELCIWGAWRREARGEDGRL